MGNIALVRRRIAATGIIAVGWWAGTPRAAVGAHGFHWDVHGLHRRNLFGQPRIGPRDARLRPNRRHRPFSCLSEVSGITCTVASGRGFTISSSGITPAG